MDIERVRRYLDENPTAYAGLRALDVSTKGREQTIAEKDEVPFIFSVVFAPLIIVYTIFKRTVYHIERRLSRTELSSATPPDHVFVMTSTYAYRTHTFEEIGKRLLDEGEDVMFLCSPSAADRMDEWRAKGFRTESFTQLLRFVHLSDLFGHIVRSIVSIYRLRRITSGEFQDSSLTYAFNSTFLEYLKFSSLEQLMEDDPTVHTYSLMPYQVRATSPEHLYVYQHGVQRSPEKDEWAATTLFPATIFVWGEAWVQNFEQLAHPDTRIKVTGSPWHDHLSKSKESITSDLDVLFLGGSQVTTHSAERNQLYTELVESLVQACNDNRWTLAIKLHPVENGDWYREHGWDQYIVDFDNIRDALNNTDIAVSHFSSAFVESIALGTPIILSDDWDHGLNELKPISGVEFANDDDLEEKIQKRISSIDADEEIVQNTQLLDIGQSVDQIVNTVMETNL
ncbi:hypothetical protein EXE41_04130 [Halorubrum sp. SD690R]|uniref:hypothetical protein n=1 Tax=Halorubrum sp. SD690R TaxID=2518117 RepID=UPI0010F4E438|nr:hypothetical protein [Halorubrum sp. SD690R]TKX47750.1 hypothetical protein EXE41_04130 [Halorubrum sp. SD690R]